MKTSEIVVGKRYNHAEYMGNVWLGIGMRKLYTQDEYVKKHLVLIESEQTPEYIGRMVQEGDDAEDGFWDLFQPEDSDSRFYIVRTN